MSSRIVIMRGGRVVQVGTPREIYDNPASIFASRFIGETNLLSGEVLRCRDGVATIRVGEHELRAAETRPLAQGTAVVLSIRPERISTGASDRASGNWNELPGTVSELVFLGNRVRAAVECLGTTIWVQEAATTPSHQRLVDKAPATIRWTVADGRVILAEEATVHSPGSGERAGGERHAS